ncbi:type II secretion system protein [Undibacterium sp. Dicai25W]|uniref:type II secretion system protein n=1 Tax=Undibacterium sp. Dicai25W TaxID=3413034 RepID=UPI003BF13224
MVTKQLQHEIRYTHIKCAEGGLAYLGLVILLAILAICASATLVVASLEQQRTAENELLFVGLEFQTAFKSYANTAPPGSSRFPSHLEDLLKDPRTPQIRRHLRKIYIDPMTKQADWATIKSEDGKYIVGVHSISEKRPIKIANFPIELGRFENAKSYRDWAFRLKF